MRLKTALLMIVAAALAFSAVASAKPGPAKPEKTRPDRACRGHVLLKGTFLSAGTDSFTMNVAKGNRRGRKLKGEQTLQVDAKTWFKRKGQKGKAALSDLVANDRLLVLARCKPGETADSFTLTARLVFARPPKAETPPAQNSEGP
jgi:hypothetical protein